MERKPHSVRAVIDNYAAVRLKRKDPTTRGKYVIAVDHWLDALGREPELADFTDVGLGEYQDYLLELAGLAEETVLSYTKKLLSLWRFSREEHWIDRRPNVELIEPADVVPIAWLSHELTRLFAAFAQLDGFVGGVPAALWWEAFHWVFWHTSERLAAVLALRWEFVNFDSAVLTFPAKTRKGKRRPSNYTIGPECVDALRKITVPTREVVFPYPFNRNTIFLHYKKILADAGLPSDRKHMFHCMRKSVSSHMEAAGINSTEALGHSSRETTRRHYIDPRIYCPIQPSAVLFDPTKPRQPRPPDDPRAA